MVLKTSFLDLLVVNSFIWWFLFLCYLEYKFQDSHVAFIGAIITSKCLSVFVLLKVNEHEVCGIKKVFRTIRTRLFTFSNLE